ncbi:hypothetical protein Tco_0669128 [Tanacetum coccineum]
MTSRRPSILNRSSTQTQTELPTDVKKKQNRRLPLKGQNRHQLEDQERQLEISRERRANLVPAEVLYSNNRIVLRDTRWEDSRKIIATMEVDLSAGTQLVYTFPDMILSVNDFHNHVEVAIQTHGVENVVDHLTTTGITAIPGERRSIEELEGMSWHLKPPEQTSVRVPSRVAVNERLNRSVSLRFERYRQTPQPPRYSVDQHDREVIRNDNLDEDEKHFIGICLQTHQEEHISYDVCFCECCLNEARILEEEPLNKVKRSNKPKQSRQRSWERWSTLGEPSGKWDYYVKYDAPLDTTPIEVTILEERSDCDDDERSGGEVLVIQERLAQNQQEFLNEYLPQWDEQLAIQKKELESEWENPFAAKRGENHTILHLSKEEENDDLPYPKFQNKWQHKSSRNMKNMHSHPPHKKNQSKTINPHMIQSWGYQSTHRHNRIHNHSIGQTISLVILKEKVKYSVEDMVSITTHIGLYHRHGHNPE